MTIAEQLSCLTDRPCDVCKFHTENGCDRWECVFEEEPDDCEYYEKERGDMTREEAIKELQESHDIMRSYDIDESESRLMTALDMAIKTLEQEPCEDWYDLPADEMTFKQARQAVKDLRIMLAEYLTQEPKTGHWIEKDGFDGDVYYDCSECGESWTTIEGTPWQNGMNYCPNCGASMKGE